jgi:hypothetical protein
LQVEGTKEVVVETPIASPVVSPIRPQDEQVMEVMAVTDRVDINVEVLLISRIAEMIEIVFNSTFRVRWLVVIMHFLCILFVGAYVCCTEATGPKSLSGI